MVPADGGSVLSSSDITDDFEVLAFGTDPESAYLDALDEIGEGFALRRATVPGEMPFGDFVALARENQRLHDPWHRVPNRDVLLAEHLAALDALPAAWRRAVNEAARFDPNEQVCCYIELDSEIAALERNLSGASAEGGRAFVFFGLRHR